MQEQVNPKKKIRIGLFDSGIGGFSILYQLLKILPSAEYFYFSDDANAPYGPKSNEFITDRALFICNELYKKEVDIIVVACNTATASSIDHLRAQFPQKLFVGVEPYLNAYYKIPDGPKKLLVLTTESMGKSERFKRLKEKLDPNGNINHIALKNLARTLEEYYAKKINIETFNQAVIDELRAIQGENYTHIILGCTHYPLIAKSIEEITQAETISPCKYVAQRVCDLLSIDQFEKLDDNVQSKKFFFCSSQNNQWVEKNRIDFILPFSI